MTIYDFISIVIIVLCAIGLGVFMLGFAIPLLAKVAEAGEDLAERIVGR